MSKIPEIAFKTFKQKNNTKFCRCGKIGAVFFEKHNAHPLRRMFSPSNVKMTLAHSHSKETSLPVSLYYVHLSSIK